jgi:hypothetical protein
MAPAVPLICWLIGVFGGTYWLMMQADSFTTDLDSRFHSVQADQPLL